MHTLTYSADPVLRYKANGGPWELVEAFTVTPVPPMTVPAGFKTDLASIPRLLRGIIPQVGRHIQPAIAHDYCYRVAKSGRSRVQADRMFLDGMKETGVRFTRRWVMYLGVRMFGWLSWRKGVPE